MGVVLAVDWNGFLIYGIPAYIAAIGGAIAAVLGQLNRRNLKTSNGKTIAEHVEATHEAVTENTGKLDAISDTQVGESL